MLEVNYVEIGKSFPIIIPKPKITNGNTDRFSNIKKNMVQSQQRKISVTDFQGLIPLF